MDITILFYFYFIFKRHFVQKHDMGKKLQLVFADALDKFVLSVFQICYLQISLPSTPFWLQLNNILYWINPLYFSPAIHHICWVLIFSFWFVFCSVVQWIYLRVLVKQRSCNLWGPSLSLEEHIRPLWTLIPKAELGIISNGCP